MRVRSRFSYCLLQYCHNPWLNEKLNIGVALYCQESNFFRLKVRSWDGRIAAAYPDINKRAFSEDLFQLKRSVERFEHNLSSQTNLFDILRKQSEAFQSGNKAYEIVDQFLSGVDSSYTWVAGGVGICSSLEDRLEVLFAKFVSAFDKEHNHSLRTDEAVWAGIKELISERNLLQKLESEPRVETELGPVKFYAGYQNGAYHAIQPLSFDLTHEDRIATKAGKWGGFSQAISSKSYRRETVAQFLVGRPHDERLMLAYSNACKFLKNIVGSENVIEEDEKKYFVDRMERDLRSH